MITMDHTTFTEQVPKSTKHQIDTNIYHVRTHHRATRSVSTTLFDSVRTWCLDVGGCPAAAGRKPGGSGDNRVRWGRSETARSVSPLSSAQTSTDHGNTIIGADTDQTQLQNEPRDNDQPPATASRGGGALLAELRGSERPGRQQPSGAADVHAHTRDQAASTRACVAPTLNFIANKRFAFGGWRHINGSFYNVVSLCFMAREDCKHVDCSRASGLMNKFFGLLKETMNEMTGVGLTRQQVVRCLCWPQIENIAVS